MSKEYQEIYFRKSWFFSENFSLQNFPLYGMSALAHALEYCANISGHVYMYLYLCYNYCLTYVAITMQNFVSWYNILITFHITSIEHIMCREQSHQVFLNLTSQSTEPCPHKWLDGTCKSPSIYIKVNIDTLSTHGANVQEQSSPTDNLH